MAFNSYLIHFSAGVSYSDKSESLLRGTYDDDSSKLRRVSRAKHSYIFFVPCVCIFELRSVILSIFFHKRIATFYVELEEYV